jgi:hypothetical protein
MEKLPKLISGKMNIPYIVCKPGYADGAKRPKRIVKAKPFNPVYVLRKAA